MTDLTTTAPTHPRRVDPRTQRIRVILREFPGDGKTRTITLYGADATIVNVESALRKFAPELTE